MGRIYRFSPIGSENELNATLEYITVELEKLSAQLLGEKLPITNLKVFPHYPQEYEYLRNLISGIGPEPSFSSETSLYVETARKIAGYDIKYLGVRIVDPYRMQVGCGDYEIDNFEEFKKKWLGKTDFIRSFREDMVEIWHPDFDVLGYVVPVL
jgi:hypothetical protein